MRYSVGLLFTALSIAGCSGGGDPGPDRFHLSGTVTFDGKPLEAGDVYIQPTPGNPGPAGFAKILNGKYDTAAEGGKGHIGGKVLLQITAGVLNPAPLPEDASPVMPFNGWEEEVDLPKETTTKDIAVPKDADKVMSKKRTVDAA